MTKITLKLAILLLFFPIIVNAQSKLTFSEYFDYSTGYCPGDPQYDNWVGLITSLDTTADKYTKITMRGTYDMVGKSCTDKYAVRQIADALYNGYDASISCDGIVWSVGTGCSDYNCGNTADYIELTLNQYTCNCGSSYTIRPGITSPNWGGMNTETCQWWYQNANQTMIVEVERIYGNDNLAVKNLVPPSECLYTQALTATIANMGYNTVNNYYVGYSINGNVQSPISVNSALNSDEYTNVVLNSNFSFSANTTYTFKIWTYDPNGNPDSETDNDTITVVYKHTGEPAMPTASDVTNCGVGRVWISANAADSIAWYDSPVGGSALSMGSAFQTPYLYSTDTFYAETKRFRNTSNAFGTGFYNYTMVSYDPNEYNGAMINVKANDLLRLSGIKVQSLFGNTTPHYKVYVREGGFGGFETDSTTWTRVFDAELTNGGSFNTIPVSIVLQPGIDYGIYVTTDPLNGEDIWINYGNSTYSNSDITISGGNFVYGKFGSNGVYTPWTLDCELTYEKTCASSTREQVVVVVNPKPYGSDLVEGSGFDGQFNLGQMSNPDIVEVGKELVYELTPPTGYNNGGFGTAWDINSVYLETEFGTPVDPSLYTFTNPGSTNGVLTFEPDANLLDSNIRVIIQTSDLGPYFCDTTITRIIHVAPTPRPNFSVPSAICAGDDIYFTNLTTVHSGGLKYMWYFTQNDSSDFVEPIMNFQNPGTYNVRLVAFTDPYNVMHDTTIAIQVGEIPAAAFKVINACEGNAVSFTNQTPGSGITYTWNFGDNTPTSNAVSPSHTYTMPDKYVVTLRANKNGCISTVKRNAYLFPTPNASFNAPSQSVCMNTPIGFTNNSTISSGKIGSYWTFGDGDISTLCEPSHAYSLPGTYRVNLLMESEFGCKDSTFVNVVIKPAPTVDFTIGKLCKNDPTQFTNLSSEFPGVSSVYNWSFSDGNTYTTKHVSRNWDLHGPKTATLKSTLSNGCEAELTKEFTVLIQPKAAFEVKDVCQDNEAIFVNKSSIEDGELKFNWYFGDLSQPSSEFHPKHIFNITSTTTYTTMLVVSVDGGCDDTAYQQITVTTTPTCEFTVAPYNQIGFNHYKFTPANATYDSYSWLFGEGGISNDVSPVYQYQFLGSFEITLKAVDHDCECELVKRVSITQTSLDKIGNDVLKVYPNPSDNLLHIDLMNSETATIRIMDNLGQVVYEGSTSQSQNEIATADFASGLYTVEITVNGIKHLVKLSIVH